MKTLWVFKVKKWVRDQLEQPRIVETDREKRRVILLEQGWGEQLVEGTNGGAGEHKI